MYPIVFQTLNAQFERTNLKRWTKNLGSQASTIWSIAKWPKFPIHSCSRSQFCYWNKFGQQFSNKKVDLGWSWRSQPPLEWIRTSTKLEFRRSSFHELKLGRNSTCDNNNLQSPVIGLTCSPVPENLCPKNLSCAALNIGPQTVYGRYRRASICLSFINAYLQ